MTSHGSRPRILVAEDNDDLRDLVRILLERAGMDVIEARTGRESLRKHYADRPDAVILDVDMPDLDGWQALERIREVSDLPVLMLTGSDAEPQKVRGLRSGADDYVTKPFGHQELIARVQALLRRAVGRAAEPERYDDGLVAIDFLQRSVTVEDRPVALTPLEFRLLVTFVRHPNQVLNREQLLDLVWNDPGFGSGDQVKLYVSYLRRKLEAATDVAPIETVRGFGYRYNALALAAARPRP